MLKPVVFVSYSHKDDHEKEALLAHLGVLQSVNLIDLWCDDRIGAGNAWEQDIDQALRRADVAILLVTANFLTSNFIRSKEIPIILERWEREGLKVVPVIAKECAWKSVGWLASLQVRPRNGRAVWTDQGGHADEDLAAIAEEVAQMATNTLHKATVSPYPVQEWQQPTSLTASAQPGPEIKKQRIWVYLQGSYPLLSEEQRTTTVNALAAALQVTPDSIDIYTVYEGSIVYELEIPPFAVKQLRHLLETNSTELHRLSIDEVVIEDELTGIDKWIASVGRFEQIGIARLGHVPTLVVGLGGAGIQVLQCLGRRDRIKMGLQSETEPEVMFRLGIDRNAFHISQSAHSVLSAHEYVRLLNPGPFDPARGVALRRRELGRAALMQGYEICRNRLNSSLQTLLESLKDTDSRPTVPPALSTNTRPIVYIVASLCGHTGAALLVSTAEAVRVYAGDRVSLVGIFMTPAIFQGVAATNLQKRILESNTYSTLMELDQYQAKGIRYPWGSDEPGVTLTGHPFDNIYLIDLANEAQYIFADAQAAAQMTARFISLCSPIAVASYVARLGINLAGPGISGPGSVTWGHGSFGVCSLQLADLTSTEVLDLRTTHAATDRLFLASTPFWRSKELSLSGSEQRTERFEFAVMSGESEEGLDRAISMSLDRVRATELFRLQNKPRVLHACTIAHYSGSLAAVAQDYHASYDRIREIRESTGWLHRPEDSSLRVDDDDSLTIPHDYQDETKSNMDSI